MENKIEDMRRRVGRCPSCRQDRLQPTGAFLICDACGLAITEQALRVEKGRAEGASAKRAS